MGNEISNITLKGQEWPEGDLKLLTPINFYQASKGLYGCGLLGQNEHFRKLESMGVKLLVVAIVDKLNDEKIINYRNIEDKESNQQSDKCEYYIPPKDYLDNLSMEILHLPINDGHPPDKNTVDIFLKRSKETIDNGDKVCVMCWTGKGRASTLISLYLMAYQKYVDPKTSQSRPYTYSIIKEVFNGRMKIKAYQEKFLGKFSQLGNIPSVYLIPKCRLCSRDGIWECEDCSQRICHRHCDIIGCNSVYCLQVCRIESDFLRNIYHQILALIEKIGQESGFKENVSYQFLSVKSRKLCYQIYSDNESGMTIEIPEDFSENTLAVLNYLCQNEYTFEFTFRRDQHGYLFQEIKKLELELSPDTIEDKLIDQ